MCIHDINCLYRWSVRWLNAHTTHTHTHTHTHTRTHTYMHKYIHTHPHAYPHTHTHTHTHTRTHTHTHTHTRTHTHTHTHTHTNALSLFFFLPFPLTQPIVGAMSVQILFPKLQKYFCACRRRSASWTKTQFSMFISPRSSPTSKCGRRGILKAATHVNRHTHV